MTDTTTLDEPGDATPEGDEHLEQLAESATLGSDGTASDDAVKTRLLLPFLLPALSMAIVAVLVLNISRVFLAGSSDAAVVIGVIITLSILGGATIIAAMPRLRTATLALILGGVLLFVSFAGFVALGPSLNDSEGGAPAGYVSPTGKAVATVGVIAEPSIKFNATQYASTPAGITEIKYSGATGHTLAIDDPKFSGFLLSSDASGKQTGKVDLTPGKYVIYCTVPGHRAQGMQATITVTAK
jgi:hypothetical protein